MAACRRVLPPLGGEVQVLMIAFPDLEPLPGRFCDKAGYREGNSDVAKKNRSKIFKPFAR
jgi:hypothetical protein